MAAPVETSPGGTSSVVPGTTDARARNGALAYLPIVVAIGLLALVPLVIGDSRTYMGLAVGVVLYACYATAFNVIFGATGQLFLCLGALAGVGGYGSAILADRIGLPLAAAMPLSALAACLLGGLFSWISVRRSLDTIFTGIVTLTFALGFTNLLLGQRDLTGGETGLVIEAGSETALAGLVSGYYAFLLLLAVYLVVFRLLQRSHFGWAFRALKDDEMTAELAGVDVARYRIHAGAIGSAMIGLAGALYAHHEGFISPTTYAFGDVDVRVLVMLAFGGIGTLLGPVIGAVSFGFIDEALRGLGQLRVAVYGAVLVALFLGFRDGVGPAVANLIRRATGRAAGD
jgi:branched-chain amino acid transport system permease protein